MRMNGSKIVIECLLEQGVDVVFGYPGGTILNLYDALYDYSDQIRHILTAHEQGAAHAADGYARSTGKVGVCFATSGPGATNLITGIATAYMDSSPVIFITCNVTYNLIGKDAFQETDITGITMPITKANYQVRDVKQLADVIREAFVIAESGRPGPILIDIMKDVSAEVTDFHRLLKCEHKYNGHLGSLFQRKSHVVTRSQPGSDQIEQLKKIILEAKRPAILCGGGIVSSGAHEELAAFAERINAPIASTLMGLGCIPYNHPLYIGMLGMHGNRKANQIITKSDLLIAVGARLNDRVALNPSRFREGKKVVQIDIDFSEINKNVRTDYHLCGDAREILTQLNQVFGEQSAAEKESTPWFQQYLGDPAAESSAVDNTHFSPTAILTTIHRVAGDNVIMVTDVGQHQMWTAQNFPFSRPRQLITSGGFGAMGFGMGAAMGAKVGNPDKPVVEITGDGCFRMNCTELSTLEHYDIPVISIIFNNGTLGMVRQWQTLLYHQRYSQTTLDRGPDFVKLAEAFGFYGERVDSLDSFEKAFRFALESGKGAVIDCTLNIDEKVTPMVQGGKHLVDFLLE